MVSMLAMLTRIAQWLQNIHLQMAIFTRRLRLGLFVEIMEITRCCDDGRVPSVSGHVPVLCPLVVGVQTPACPDVCL
jgi:hypothetical protein